MGKRDKELEMDNNYRKKLWNESLDQVNSNLVNIHNVLTELEGSMNNLAQRQVLRLFHMLKLFLSVGTKVVKHYITVEVHRLFPQGVVS